jgi:hypothetical protein
MLLSRRLNLRSQEKEGIIYIRIGARNLRGAKAVADRR